MKVRKILACILAFAMILSTMSFTAFADDNIIEVGTGKAYEKWSAALAAAADADGDGIITYHVYGQVAMDSYSVKGAAATINIVGMTEDAELLVETAKPDDNGVVYVLDNTIETVNFTNLKLSRPNGAWKNNEGHHNRFFTVWDSDASTDLITYTDCVFPYGSGNNQYGKTTYTGCTFNNDTYYALWIYGSGSNASVEVTGCTFVADRGVKIYAEDAAATVNTKITTSTFDIASKPAIVSSIAGSLEIAEVDATDCEYGLLASEPKDGRTDLTAATVTVDGKTPVYVAQVGTLFCTDLDYAQAEAGADKEIVPVVAAIGNKFFTTLADAVAAAQENDVIDLLGNVIDLPEVNSLKITKDLTIQNGTIDITNGVWNGNSIIEIYGGTASDFVTVTFNNVDFVGDNYSSAYGVIYAYNYGKAVINDSDFVLSNERFSAGGVLKGNGVAQSAFDVNNSTFTLENPNRIIANSTVNLDNVTIDAVVTDDTLVVGDMNNHAFRNLVGTVNDSNISVDGFETGIKNTDGSLNVTGDSKVVLTNSKDTDLIVSGNNSLSVADTSELLADTTDISSTSSVTGNVVKKADAVEVDFEYATSDETSLTYNIVLKGINAETINRLNSADLTFALKQTNGKNSYEIIDVANDNIAVNPVYNVEDGSIIDGRYEFHFEHKDGVANDTAAKIVIAQVKFTGYGKFNFVVAESATNEVHATKIRDNIVETYIPVNNGSDIVEGELVVDKFIKDAEIIVPKRDLTINVSFPNAIEENVYAYQNMKITVTGPDKYVKVIYLGNGDTVKENGDCLSLKNGGYSTVISGELTLNSPYTVTLEGAGYRTVKYTVNMTEDKTLNFWNNVKDNAKAVEVSESSVEKYAQTVTFLAGDIVKDNDINVYDLSAVVSYFGEIDLDADNKPEYAKYDLNRDGKIDSKDVAYVLVSWGN